MRGVLFLKGIIEERACDLAVYIIENKATVRAAAKKFGISKSTVHTVVTQRTGFYADETCISSQRQGYAGSHGGIGAVSGNFPARMDRFQIKY
jgi:hypothetical protein